MNMIMNLGNYPIFGPDQVLTDEDLNRLVSYVEGLNQFTRIYFVGMGIAYGLEVQYFSQPTRLEITPGCGITSEGFVVQMTAATGTNLNATFTHYREIPIAKSLFISEEGSPTDPQVKELLPSTIAQAGGANVHSLTEEVLAQQVVVVLYDWEDFARSQACRLNYDQQSGKDRQFRLRFFLLPCLRSQNTDAPTLSAEELIRKGYQINQLPDYWKTFDQDYGTAAIFEARNQFLASPNLALRLRRFGYDEAEQRINLTRVKDYPAFQDNYFGICKSAIATISKAFPELFRLFSPFFSSFNPDSKHEFQNLEQTLTACLQRFSPSPEGVILPNTEPAYALQYFYDYLSQLIAAYTELREAAFDLMDDSTPDTGRFPRFLMLGQIPPLNDPPKPFEVPSAYRTRFLQPRIYNNSQQRLQQVRHLYDRLLKLCDFEPGKESFFPLPFYKTPIRIIPSRDRTVPLSDRAIPYYLNYPKLYEAWNYDAYRKGRSKRLPAYFHSDPAHVFDELTYQPHTDHFYRIEGHLGRSTADALKGVQDYQQRYNLPFDVITLKLGNLASLKDLNLAAQFDHLNDSFQGLKDKFNLLWKTNENWSANVLLMTLNRIFFSKTSLAEVNPDHLVNRLLERAKLSESYEFEPEQNSLIYRLFLKDADGRRIAQYIFRDRNQAIKLLDFTRFVNNVFPVEVRPGYVEAEQKRIVEGLVDALTPDKIKYRVERQSSDLLRFYLYYSSPDQLTVPLGDVNPEPATIELQDSFSIQEKPDLAIAESNCPDVLTLYGLLRDVPANYGSENQLSFGLGNPNAAQLLGSAELTALIEAYQQQLARLANLHLFQTFAEQHPGMEPLGGVPKGGTFILVYADGKDTPSLLTEEQNQEIYKFRTARAQSIQAVAAFPAASSQTGSSWEELLKVTRDRKDIVVADFCLPYRSSSNAPAVSYVLARPRPIVLLPKIVFCEDDRTSYPFILEPEGGMVKGEGVQPDSDRSRFAFNPSSISDASKAELKKGNEINITFSYAVDNTYDTLTVAVYPQPIPELSIQAEQTFCRSAESIEIKLAAATSDTIELVSVNISGTETKTLNPSQYATTGQAEIVMIVAQVRDRTTQCTNTITRTVTIYPLPEAPLTIQNGQNFCQNAPSVTIALAEPSPADVELVQVTINGIETTTLNPAQYATQGQPETVAIVAQLRNSQTQCENTLNYTVTIKPLPNAEFQIEAENQTAFLSSHAAIALNPSQPGGSFEARVGEQNISQTVLRDNQFIPDAVQLGEGETEKTVTLKYIVTQDSCRNETTQTVTIFAPPVIAALHLLTIDPDGGVIDQLALEDEQTFSRSFFTERYQFEAQVNGKVNSVVFTYKSPNDLEEVLPPVNSAPYLMPKDWQPIVGTHTIAAQPYSESDREELRGETRSIKITIVDDPEDSESSAPDGDEAAAASTAHDTEATTPSVTLLQPDSLPASTVSSFLAPFTPAIEPLGAIPNTLSIPVSPPGASLSPSPEPQPAPIQPVPSHPDPVSPWSAEPPKPKHSPQPKLIQALTLGAIAVLLSLIWIYSGSKPPTPQPNSSNLEQSVP